MIRRTNCVFGMNPSVIRLQYAGRVFDPLLEKEGGGQAMSEAKAFDCATNRCSTG